MLRSLIGAAAAAAALLAATPVSADPGPPGFVEHTEWADYDGLPSLRVYPTQAARTAANRPDRSTDGATAWREVLARAPEADTPTMRDQFLCHWSYAELTRPGKASWNLEPWRPVVDGVTMLESGCNPGAAEEVF